MQRPALLGALLCSLLVLGGCGDDDGADVREIGEDTGSGSGSGTGSETGSGT